MKSMIFLIAFNFTLISFAWDMARGWAWEKLHGKPPVAIESPEYGYVDGKLMIIAK